MRAGAEQQRSNGQHDGSILPLDALNCPPTHPRRYNLGQVAIGIGDLGLAYQVLKVAVAVDGVHAESLTNLGVLELRRGNIEQARSQFRAAQRAAEHMFEPWYNGGARRAALPVAAAAGEAFPALTARRPVARSTAVLQAGRAAGQLRPGQQGA